MGDERSRRVAVAFAREVVRSPHARLCAAAVDVIGVAGAGLTLMRGVRPGPICVSDARVAPLEQLQFRSGRGPCQDAIHQGRFLHAPRFDDRAAARWPAFVELAGTTGVGAVFAYPLAGAADARSVGVLTLYQDTEGELTDEQHHDSLAVADVLGETVLGVRAPALPVERADATAHTAQVHQASGMVAIQLHVSVDEALSRIEAHALASGMSVATVAKQIVGRRLRLAAAIGEA